VEINGELRKYKRGYTIDQYTPWLKKFALQSPILGDGMTDYVNRADVREAMNIPATIPSWESCSSNLDYHSQTEGSLWIYTVLQNKYRILFYSGDTDGAVPTFGTRQWIQELGWEVLSKWTPWYTNGQISGYKESYNGLDFVTVHGVGHMAPQWKRQDVTQMITAWVHGQDF
jgi:serine carboxypeptidase-like clade 1